LNFHRARKLIGARMKERLRAELNLTPEQVAKISPIIDKSSRTTPRNFGETRPGAFMKRSGRPIRQMAC